MFKVQDCKFEGCRAVSLIKRPYSLSVRARHLEDLRTQRELSLLHAVDAARGVISSYAQREDTSAMMKPKAVTLSTFSLKSLLVWVGVFDPLGSVR